MLEDDPKSLFLTDTAFRALEKATDIGVVPRPAERAHRHDSDNDRHWQSKDYGANAASERCDQCRQRRVTRDRYRTKPERNEQKANCLLYTSDAADD